jgi:hypothetical protein
LALLFAVADGVVGTEGYEPPVGGDLGDATLHQLPHVQGVGVLEVLDDDHERFLGQAEQGVGEVDAA